MRNRTSAALSTPRMQLAWRRGLGPSALVVLLVLAAGASQATNAALPVEIATPVQEARRTWTFDFTMRNVSDSPADFHLGIVDIGGNLLAGPVDCLAVPSYGTCTVPFPVLFPAFDLAVFGHGGSSTEQVRGGITARDGLGNVQTEDDAVVFRPNAASIRLAETCLRPTGSEPDPFSCTVEHTALVGGIRTGWNTCNLVNLGTTPLEGAQLSHLNPDGTVQAGPFVCSPIAPLTACVFEDPIVFPDYRVYTSCKAEIPTTAEGPWVGNHYFQDWSNQPQASSPLSGAVCVEGAMCAVDDTNPCTEPLGVCNADGACTPTPILGCCVSDANCDDGNLCTSDSCEVDPGDLAGTCSNVEPDCPAETCSEGYCDPDDGECKQMDRDCGPNDACTFSLCVEATDKCVSLPTQTCTASAACVAALCDPLSGCIEVDACPDGEQCNRATDSCEPE